MLSRGHAARSKAVSAGGRGGGGGGSGACWVQQAGAPIAISSWWRRRARRILRVSRRAAAVATARRGRGTPTPMFTGLVEDVGTVARADRRSDALVLAIRPGRIPIGELA